MTSPHTKNGWEAWQEEREDFLARETEGFTKDLRALKQHIRTLGKVCPKDEAGFPVQTALIHIDRLTKEYNRFKTYISAFSK